MSHALSTFFLQGHKILNRLQKVTCHFRRVITCPRNISLREHVHKSEELYSHMNSFSCVTEALCFVMCSLVICKRFCLLIFYVIKTKFALIQISLLHLFEGLLCKHYFFSLDRNAGIRQF